MENTRVASISPGLNLYDFQDVGFWPQQCSQLSDEGIGMRNNRFLNDYNRHIKYVPILDLLTAEWCTYFHFHFICGKNELLQTKPTHPDFHSIYGRAVIQTHLISESVFLFLPSTSLHLLSFLWLSSEIMWFFSQLTQSSYMKVSYIY